MTKCVAELNKFCNTTSVIGLSRILKSKTVFLKVLWTIFVLVCTAFLIYFLVAIFVEYYKYPVTTEFKQDPRANIIFPDVTVCSLNQVLNDGNIGKEIDEYFNVVEQLEGVLTNAGFFLDLYNMPAVMRNIPKHFLLTKDCPKLFAECKLYGKNWQALNISCNEHFTEVWNIDYYSCFTIRTSEIGNTTIIKGMSLILNNGPPNDVQVPYETFLDKSQGTGLHLTIHRPGTSPDLKRGLTLSPGTENDITIVQTNIDRLDKPYNPLGCTKQKYLRESPSIKYTQDQCIEQCLQSRTYKKCDCTAEWFSVPESLNGAIVCGNLTDIELKDKNIFDVLFQLNCSKYYNDAIKECETGCLIPCNEINYKYFLTSRSWPHNSMQLAIYRKYFKTCISDFPGVLERYAAYDYLNEIRLNVQESNSSAKNYSFSDLKQISESLLSVKMVIEDDFPFAHIDKPLYTWDHIVGVVGGTLGVWMGISAVFILEVLELIYFLIKSCF